MFVRIWFTIFWRRGKKFDFCSLKIALDIDKLLLPEVISAVSGLIQLAPELEVAGGSGLVLDSFQGADILSAGIAKGTGYNIFLLRMQFCSRDLEDDRRGSLSFNYLPWCGTGSEIQLIT